MTNKKSIKIFSTTLFFSIIFAFILYFSIPQKVILCENSKATVKIFPMCSVNGKSIEDNEPLVKTSGINAEINSLKKGNFQYNLKLFDQIPIKKLNVSVIPTKYVVPSGEAIGVKIYTDGLLVIYRANVTDKNGVVHSPAKDAGIKVNDRILKIDSLDIHTNEEFFDYVNEKRQSVNVLVARGEEVFKTKVEPIECEDGNYRVGLWVRDSTAGIGTLSYYCPDTKEYAALGHAISDNDTDSILKISGGALVNCSIVSVKKGENGQPGELCGAFSGADLGTITKNNEFGIFGKLNEIPKDSDKKKIPMATRFQVKCGPAKILCDVDKAGVREYDIEIVSVSKSSVVDNKGIVLRVTDEELLNKTGGIVQGMSGSPIIQNGKLIGAVTHVFVNDPTRGYGIFIENMLSEAEN